MRNHVFSITMLLLFTLPTSGCIIGLAGIRGSGNLVTYEENISGFDGVEVGHGCKLTLSQGNRFRVIIRIDDNLREYLEVEVKGSTLDLGLKSGQNYRNVHFEADIEMPDLRKLSLSGGSRGLIDGFRLNHDLTVGLSGGSRAEGMIETQHLKVGASGGARADLSGTVESLELNGSGGSELSLGDLESGPVRVSLSGGSRSTLLLNGPLTGSLSGGSSVYYSGDPTEIRVTKSGGARVVRR